MRALEHLPVRDILGVKVSVLEWLGALKALDEALGEGRPQHIVNFLNANNANIAQANERYRLCLAHSQVLPDGIGVDIAAKALYGEPFPSNLNGTDLVPAFLVHMARPLRVALIGAREDVLEKALASFRRISPWHEFCAVSDGYFKEGEAKLILADLARFKPDVTLVALGSPMQEIWIDAHMKPEHGQLVFGVGALFDFVSGITPRAPKIVRSLRLEWAYRLLREPARLWRRYILGNPLFLLRVLRHRLFGPRFEPSAAR